MTKDEILKALSNVQEPDLGKDLVTAEHGKRHRDGGKFM